MLTRDQLINESRIRGGNLPALLGIYGTVIMVLAFTASAII
jgi:hypothetical protein